MGRRDPGEPDWDAIFDGYRSTTDYPGCCFWPELMEHYPDAKVLLSVRDAEGWFDSVSATLFSPAFRERALQGRMGELNRRFTMGIDEHMLSDRAFMTDYFDRWNQSVIDAVPADRLLVFSARDGWDPLCSFLGVPVPEAPYPRVNSRDALNEELGGAQTNAGGVAAQLRAYLESLRQNAFGPVA